MPRSSLFLLKFIALALVLLAPRQARAQRGMAYERQETSETRPNSRFPGSFDTNLLRPGQWSLDLPFLNVWYGATENLSIGTNALLLAPSIAGLPSLNMSLRYRLWSRADALSTLTVNGGFVAAEVDAEMDKSRSDAVRAGFATLSSSTTLFRDWGALTGSVVAGRLIGRVTSFNSTLMQDIDAETQITGVVLATTYDRFFGKRFGIQATLGSAPVVFGQADDPGSSVAFTISDLGSIADRSFVRALLQLRLGNWLVNGGGIKVLSGLEAPTPWLSFQWSSSK